MKYFTKEIWAGWQTDQYEKWHRIHKRNHRNYWRQLKRLKTRLGRSIYRFMTTESLHDGTLLAFNVATQKSKHKPVSTRVEIRVLALGRIITPMRLRKNEKFRILKRDKRKVCVLKYEGVRKILFDFPSATPLFYEPGDDMGDWGYDEMTSAGRKFLRHEILFSSGSTILLEFKRFHIAWGD